MEMRRPCPYYATTKLKFFGMTIEAAFVGTVSLAVTNSFLDPMYSLFIGGGMAWLVQRKMRGYPGGYLQYRLSLFSASDTAKKYCPWFAQQMTGAWKYKGSIPAPSVVKRYKI